MRIEIDVTQHHINEGRSGEYNSCPIALVLWEAGYKDINVDDAVVKLRYGRKNLEFLPPKEVRIFIDDFDNFRQVKPQKFELSKLLLPVIKT